MKILAVESASKTASVAILENDVLIAEYTTNHKATHSQTLLPMIDEICTCTHTALETLDAIAISSGPGSFTGLRIGSATVKGLGLALDKPLIEVPTLEGMAYNLAGFSGLICPMLDARRSHVYAAVYGFEGNVPQVHLQPSLIGIEDLVEQLAAMGERVTFLGDGVTEARSCIEQKATFSYAFALPSMNTPRAGSVAQAAARRFEKGERTHADEHAPDYLRPSQAERELDEKLKRAGEAEHS